MARIARRDHYRFAYEHSLRLGGRTDDRDDRQPANWLRDNGQAQESRDELLAVLALAETVFGPETSATAETLRGLGLSQIALGDLAAARASLERSLAIHIALFGNADGPLARIRESIAKLEAAEAAAPWEDLNNTVIPAQGWPFLTAEGLSIHSNTTWMAFTGMTLVQGASAREEAPAGRRAGQSGSHPSPLAQHPNAHRGTPRARRPIDEEAFSRARRLQASAPVARWHHRAGKDQFTVAGVHIALEQSL